MKDLLKPRGVLHLLTSYFDQRFRSRCMSRALFRPSSASIPVSCRGTGSLFQRSALYSNPEPRENNSRPRLAATRVSPSSSCACAATAIGNTARRSVACLSVRSIITQLFHILYISFLSVYSYSVFFLFHLFLCISRGSRGVSLMLY